MSGKPSRGRPRSTRAHEAVLEATRDLLGAGYDQLTIEGIAAAAGVGRQTVYRWWPSKSALVAEAVLAGYMGFETDTPPDTGDLRGDLVGWLDGVLALLGDPRVVPLIEGLTAAALESENTKGQLYAQITTPFRDAIRVRLEQGAAAGEVRAGADLAAAADALLGVIFLQVMAGSHLGVGERGSEGFVDVLLHGVAAGGRDVQ